MIPAMETSQVASIEALQAHAASHPAKWIECRESGHAMTTIRVGLSEAKGAFERTRRCSRCYTKKHQVVDSKGMVISSEYEYPDGYTLPKGTGRMDSEGRDALRSAAINHALERQLATQERATRERAPRRRKSA